jgi:hypothetical protein
LVPAFNLDRGWAGHGYGHRDESIERGGERERGYKEANGGH